MQFLKKTNNSITSLIILILLISSFFILKFALQKEKVYYPKMIDNQIFTDFEVEELIDESIIAINSSGKGLLPAPSLFIYFLSIIAAAISRKNLSID